MNPFLAEKIRKIITVIVLIITVALFIGLIWFVAWTLNILIPEFLR